MAATVQLRRLTGSGPTYTNVSSGTTRLSTSDSASPGTSNPIPIHASLTKYSYWAVFQLNCTVTPSGSITNIKAYMDGANGFGTGVTFLMEGATSYIQATGTPGDTGDELEVANYATLYQEPPADGFDYDVGSPLDIAGSLSNPSTGNFGEFVVCQLAISPSASPGLTPSEVLTLAYDET